MIFKKIKRAIKYYPITMVIVLVSTSIFVIHILLGEYGNYNRVSIIALGGLDKELINQGEIWRLFTYTFGHMSSLHFIINIFPLLFLSISLEKYYGSIRFLLFFLISTIGAGISIYMFYRGSYLTLAGLSGTGYGFIGIFIFILIINPYQISLSFKIFISLMLIYGTFSIFFNNSSEVANSGHIGGFISGFVLSFVMFIICRNKYISEESPKNK